ncbi:MAG: hypothetical protein J7L34_07795 [Thermotogaceae bacterium]|nr:hypothetical protein [Thermotogaceae bacterium]
MRSILQNHFDEFLEILKYDKTEWYEFWKDYRKRYGPIVPDYEKLHNLDEKIIKSILDSLTRPQLDKLKQYWDGTKAGEKRRVSKALRSHSEELELSKADFVVFLFGGLGISTFSIVNGLREKVILIDLVKVWKDGKIENLEEIVLNSVFKFRKGEKYGS